MNTIFSFAVIAAISAVSIEGLKKPSCEVCVGVLTKVLEDMESGDRTDQEKLDDKIKEYCGGSKGKENRFCYYIGALPESASYIMNEVTLPLSWPMKPEGVCERLRTKDGQICALEYDKEIDWDTVDLNTLKVKELKKILEDWDAQCKGCTEKTEYVQRVRELMPQNVPVKTEL